MTRPVHPRSSSAEAALGGPDVAGHDFWDLADLYPSRDAWAAAREAVLAALPGIKAKKGTLGESAEALYDASRLISDAQKEALRVWSWASLTADEDLRIPEAQEDRQLAQAMFTRLSEAAAWYRPQILGVGRERIMSLVDSDPRLETYRQSLDDILRRASYTLGDEAELILAAAGEPLAGPYHVYGLLANSDIAWPTIELSTGEEVRLDAQAYAAHRQSGVREDRRKVFDAYWGKWSQYRNTVGMTLTSHLQSQVFLSRSRGYASVLERELFDDNVPAEVYTTLVAEVNAALPTLHRYFALRARMLGVEQMRYYDIYPPLVSFERDFTLADAKTITLDALAVLGDEWVETQRDALSRRWMHVYPQQGKRSGAYMSGSAYDVHPFLLLNFNNDYESVSTFAHEWGHAMHTLYSQQSQPFETASYAIFTAEIPSTTVEMILQQHMVEGAATASEKLFYLDTGLEQLRGTFFRQTMFAEFELSLYEATERGEALSGKRISQMYAEILRRYHGHDDGVVFIDDLYTNEWMFIQHFYYNMYVYQYATSIAAGAALLETIRAEGEPAVLRFIELLRAGGSDYPNELLLAAGVDLAGPQPYRALVRRMDRIMDEIEEVLEG
jgi:oligoendopeptidase F